MMPLRGQVSVRGRLGSILGFLVGKAILETDDEGLATGSFIPVKA